MSEIPYDKLERDLPVSVRLLISDLVLAWASFDTVVSYWTSLVFGLDLDVSSILLGTMTAKTKLDRMKLLAEHLGQTEAVASIASLASQERDMAECRNTIAHRRCIGLTTDDAGTEWLVFTSTKHMKKERGMYEVRQVDLNEIRASASFASQASDKILEMVKPLADRYDATWQARQEARNASPPEAH